MHSIKVVLETLCYAIFFTVCGTSTALAYKTFTAENFALVGHQYKKISNIEFSKCVKACKSERSCISVNFEAGFLESKGCCAFNGCGVEDETDKEKSLTFSPGCKYHQVRRTEAALKKGGKYGGNCPVAAVKVDGIWSQWSSWSNCSKSCGTGSRMRSRSCTNPSPSHGGSNCSGSRNETEACNTQNCPVHGKWSQWSKWTDCSKSCGNGVRMRSKTCTNPPPSDGGSNCPGSHNETGMCNTHDCLVNGNWSEWLSWSNCSKSCGKGIRMRSRTCTNPPPSHGGSSCPGSRNETEACNTHDCPVHGKWSQWSSWTNCSKSCGNGTRMRSRTCTNPPPSHGGSNCSGSRNETDLEACNTQNCPVNGNWSQWSSWTNCSKSCSNGIRMRSRTCINPPPSHGGSNCSGSRNETEACNEHDCPVQGEWSQWSSWSNCSKSCSNGIRMRRRSCSDPPPSHGGSNCSGSRNEKQSCNTHDCPVDGHWSEWLSWSNCSKNCGNGARMRSRTCTNPPPSHEGSNCSGSHNETEACNTHDCPVHKTCKDAKTKMPASKSGQYLIDPDGGFRSQSFQAFCDMDTDGGGWTLVWSYTFTNYAQFENNQNAVTPIPNWAVDEPFSGSGDKNNAQTSSRIPSNETNLGALDFQKWKKIGQEFLLKSNINNWVACIPQNGDLVRLRSGQVSCRLVKLVSPLCNNTVPDFLKLQLSYPALRVRKKGRYYFYESSTVSKWPVHDPCGKSQPNHVKGVANPRGNIYIR